jgi:uncharacterized protein YkwD
MHRTGVTATIVAAAVLVGTLLVGAGPAGASSGGDVERLAFCKVNDERRARGLAPLAWDGAIADSARSWSGHMAAAGSLAHDPDLQRVLTALVPGLTHAAENVGRSFTGLQVLHDTFMASPGHRAHILRAEATRVGIGVVTDGAGQLWVTQRFVAGPAPADPDTCPGGAATVAASTPGRTPFTDVPAGAYYEDAVAWAVEHGITKGTTVTTFSPAAPVARGQVASLLWRASGRPAPTGDAFADVPADAHFARATTWMRGTGMWAACAPDRFCPSAHTSRAAAVAWLWQAAGSPDLGTAHGFADVPAGAPYEAAVTWAVRTGITSGTTATTFSPEHGVTRGQAVTFLWRAMR